MRPSFLRTLARRWLPLGAAFLLALPLARPAQGDRSVYDIRGDTLRRVLTEDGPVTILRGNFELEGKDLQLRSETARHYELLDQYVAVGSVHAVSESLTLWCDSLRLNEVEGWGHAMGRVRLETPDGLKGRGRRGFYWRETDQLALAGRAQVIDSTLVVSGDSLHFDRPQDRMEAFGDVRVVDEANATVVHGRHGVFERTTGVAWVDSLPVLSSRRGDEPTITVESRTMIFEREQQRSTAVGEVRFRQGATRAEADTARFEGEDLLVLTGMPRVEQERRVMTGDVIHFLYEDDQIRQIDVYGSARLVDATPDTLDREFSGIPLANELTGDTLRIYIRDDEIRRTKVVGNAHSVYLPEDQASTVSVNDVRGRSIDIRFDDQKVDRVTVDGAVEGIYRFFERRKAQPDSTVAGADSLAASPDSLAARTARGGQATADSLGAEGGKIDFNSSADKVGYWGQRTVFHVQHGRIHISGEGRVEHGTLTLSSEHVFFDTNERELLAEGDPLLVDKESELVGNRMGYLFEPQTGAVGSGATRFDDGFYYGKHIRRIDKSTLLVRDGSYTTCDLAEPHYHFSAKRMKLKLGERVVARQVTFHVSNLPLMTLPFYYKSLDSGRHSGIIFPQIQLGVSSREGRYIKDLGYYWATNEYTDFQFRLDYNERKQATFSIENRYNLRYRMSGNAKFEYLRFFEDNEFSSRKGDEWRLKASHRQPELFDVWNASATVDLSSRSISVSNLGSDNRNDLIDGQLRTNGSVSRSWDNGARLSLSASRDQFPNAEDGDLLTDKRIYTQTLPRFTLSLKSRPLLGPAPRGEEGNPLANILRDIQFGQSYNGDFNRTKNELSQTDVMNLRGSYSLRYAPSSRVGPFKLTSSASYGHGWKRTSRTADVYADSLFFDPVDSTETTVVYLDERIDSVVEETTPSLSFSNQLGTDLYGIFRTDLGPVTGIKHHVGWNVSHSYRPQLGDKQASSQSFGLSMVNDLSLKIRQGDREEEAEEDAAEEKEGGREREGQRDRKLDQLLRWNLSTSYDPDAEPGQRWSDITSGILVRPGVTQAISLDVSQTIDANTFDVKSTRITTGLRLDGSLDLGGELLERQEQRNAVVDRLPEAEVDSAMIRRQQEEEERWGLDSGFEGDPRSDLRWGEESTGENRLRWSFNTRASITQSRATDGSKSTRANVSTNASLRFPGQWSLSYSAGFDVESGEFTNQYWSLRRDLHCWTVEFNRGYADGEDFGFRLYLRQIPDLEVTRGNRNAGDNLKRRLGSF